MKTAFALASGVLAMAAAPLVSAAPGVDDRLTLSANGSTIIDASGGGGGSIGWLHNFSANTIVGAAVEYQSLVNSHWSFGSLSMSLGRGDASRRSTFYADAHVGSGDDGVEDFDYATYVAGMYQNLSRRVTLQLEDKQVDIGRTHGNLPKIGIQVLATPRLLTNISYAHSISGNLGTKLGFIRVDYYGRSVNFIIGGAGGKASPDIVDLHGLFSPGQTLREGFIGIGKPLKNADLMLLGDYINLGGTERVTVTLNCTMHLRGRGGSR